MKGEKDEATSTYHTTGNQDNPNRGGWMGTASLDCASDRSSDRRTDHLGSDCSGPSDLRETNAFLVVAHVLQRPKLVRWDLQKRRTAINSTRIAEPSIDNCPSNIVHLHPRFDEVTKTKALRPREKRPGQGRCNDWRIVFWQSGRWVDPTARGRRKSSQQDRHKTPFPNY